MRSASASCPSISTLFGPRDTRGPYHTNANAKAEIRAPPRRAARDCRARSRSVAVPPRAAARRRSARFNARMERADIEGQAMRPGARGLGHPAQVLRRPRPAPGRDARLLRAALAVPVRVPGRLAGQRDRPPRGDLHAAARPQPRAAGHERAGPRAARAQPRVERGRDRPDRRRRAAVVVARLPLGARVGAQRALRAPQPRLPAPEAARARPARHGADRAPARPHARGREPDGALRDRAGPLAPGRLEDRRRHRDQHADDVPLPAASSTGRCRTPRSRRARCSPAR